MRYYCEAILSLAGSLASCADHVSGPSGGAAGVALRHGKVPRFGGHQGAALRNRVSRIARYRRSPSVPSCCGPICRSPWRSAGTTAGGTSFAPFAAYVGGGAALIVAAGWLVLLQAVPLSRPTVMRRIMMGAGLTVSLFVTAVLAAGLVGQAGVADARESHVDVIVLAMGSGAALPWASSWGSSSKRTSSGRRRTTGRCSVPWSWSSTPSWPGIRSGCGSTPAAPSSS